MVGREEEKGSALEGWVSLVLLTPTSDPCLMIDGSREGEFSTMGFFNRWSSEEEVVEVEEQEVED